MKLPTHFKGIRLVVTDMDGTLLNPDHEVSGRFFELFDALSEKGVIFAAASGRQYNSIVSKLQPIRDRIYVIAENGGLAMFGKREIVSTPLDALTKNTILDSLSASRDIHPVLCARNNAYVTGHSPDFLRILKEYYTEFEVIENLHHFEDEVMKIAAYHFESSEKYIYPLVTDFEQSLMVKISGRHWVDISHPLAHKGFALEKIQQELGIGPEHTMVFGDYNNDLEMMSLSHYSFAMANAHPNVAKAARYSTLSNQEKGVEIILERLLQSLD
ncbi:HAD family hydrolase [Muriicola marianensis]|uniref:Hydrolase n=1 Tax=Muriicola marianensis TaxID=1324801 RepID=A0ABQ1QTJ4_9FLAO|nr:HAD family hydrolase [Muriicola marianensis]GGD43001.1 hydrolase [Muriicola marianensis]